MERAGELDRQAARRHPGAKARQHAEDQPERDERRNGRRRQQEQHRHEDELRRDRGGVADLELDRGDDCVGCDKRTVEPEPRAVARPRELCEGDRPSDERHSAGPRHDPLAAAQAERDALTRRLDELVQLDSPLRRA